MGRRGPKPQPTALKLARGNPGKRALPIDEPKLGSFPRDVPKGMTGVARQEWLRLVNELADKGVLTVGDLRVFERYCRLVAAETAAVALIEKVGLETALAEKHDRYLDRVQSQLTRQESRLGLDPSSRSAIKAEKGAERETPQAKLARLYGSGRQA